MIEGHLNADEFLQAMPERIPTENTSSEQVGGSIGPCRLLQKIGEGDCGVVYMAEQEKPVSRRVVFKVIKLGKDTRNVIARFKAERQALVASLRDSGR